VAGERGSKDTARDLRGFAVKFDTDEGNWGLVGRMGHEDALSPWTFPRVTTLVVSGLDF